jgi:endonuclease/exonuclease/phosphatase (EEP) superfamily protein YafD
MAETKESRTWRTRLRGGWGWLVLAVAALWLGYDLTRRLTGGSWHWSILLDLTPPLVLVLLPLTLLAASALASGRQRLVAAVLALLGVLPGLDQTGVNFSALCCAGRGAPAGAIHVVTWNTDQWGVGDKDPEAKFRLLKRQPADIYVLQEHSKEDTYKGELGYTQLFDDAKLRQEFPGYFIAERSEFVTISRFPIMAEPVFGPITAVPASASFDWKLLRDRVLRTDLLVDGHVLSLYNVHITLLLAKDVNPWSRLALDPNFDAYFRRKFQWRQEEVDAIANDLRANPHPALLTGDFNTTSSMSTIDPLRVMTTDATATDGQLLPVSWRVPSPEIFDWHNPLAGVPLPFWRIDWTFSRGPVTVDRYELRSSEGLSDHAVQDFWFSMP